MPRKYEKLSNDPCAVANRAKQARRATRYRAMKTALEHIAEASRVPVDIKELARAALRNRVAE